MDIIRRLWNRPGIGPLLPCMKKCLSLKLSNSCFDTGIQTYTQEIIF